MGGFFLTNQANKIEPALALMKQKGFHVYNVVSLGSVSLLVLQKLNIKNHRNSFQCGNDWIFGFGTYYRDHHRL